MSVGEEKWWWCGVGVSVGAVEGAAAVAQVVFHAEVVHTRVRRASSGRRGGGGVAFWCGSWQVRCGGVRRVLPTWSWSWLQRTEGEVASVDHVTVYYSLLTIADKRRLVHGT